MVKLATTGGVQSWPGSASAAIRVTPSRMVVDGAAYVIEHDVPAAHLPRWLTGLLTRPAPVS